MCVCVCRFNCYIANWFKHSEFSVKKKFISNKRTNKRWFQNLPSLKLYPGISAMLWQCLLRSWEAIWFWCHHVWYPLPRGIPRVFSSLPPSCPPPPAVTVTPCVVYWLWISKEKTDCALQCGDRCWGTFYSKMPLQLDELFSCTAGLRLKIGPKIFKW